MNEPKKVSKPNQPKPIAPTIRASTRVTAQKAKEVSKGKKDETQKRSRRKYVAQAEFDKEKIELDENN